MNIIRKYNYLDFFIFLEKIKIKNSYKIYNIIINIPFFQYKINYICSNFLIN